MLVEYETPRFVHEGGIDLTKLTNVEYGSLSALGFYREEAKVEYFSKHEDSMEIQLVELVHALAKKMKDVKQSYGKKIQ
jgi:hypothetical protein